MLIQRLVTTYNFVGVCKRPKQGDCKPLVERPRMFESCRPLQKLGIILRNGCLFGERGSRFPWPQAQRQGIAK